MGCLKFIIRVIIIVLAIIGFKSLGGWDWIVSNWHFFERPTQEKLIEKSMDVADFSRIPEEYEISKSANVLGYRAVIAEHDATGQKMAVVNQNKTLKLSKDDFKNGKLENKINEINKNLKYQYVHVENFKITKQKRSASDMHSFSNTLYLPIHFKGFFSSLLFCFLFAFSLALANCLVVY